MKTVTCLGQPSWHFASDRVEAAITRQGGHLAPVRFRLGKKIVSPFSVAPWAEEKTAKKIPPLLQSLRGDFFCAPFGGSDLAWRNENHPPHGETANALWNFESLTKTNGNETLHLSLNTRVRAGRIDKKLFLRKGETVVYSRHILSRFSGRMNLGHHATLKFPDEPGAGRISTSRIQFAQVLPFPFENPEQGGYSCLKPGAMFKRLDKVPRTDGTMADLSRYPARRGFDDLALVVHQDKPDFAWTAAAFPAEGYVWFALKDPRILQSTTFWISNGGRHYPPWNGRHINVLGMEDVTSYFHCGLAPSLRANALTRRGYATSIAFPRNVPLIVNYVMGVAAIPHGFQSVKSIVPSRNGVTIASTDGQRVFAPLNLGFLYENSL